MNREKLQALKDSVVHWFENSIIEDMKDANTYAASCALCEMFNYPSRHKSKQCKGCPVFKETGQMACIGTPYTEALIAKKEKDLIAFRAAAREEVAFLASLLPKEELRGYIEAVLQVKLIGIEEPEDVVDGQ